MKVPSTLLLRAMLRPQLPLCQIRLKSDWMPREKYAKITLLDKLHRRQKAALRKERQDSQLHAENMTAESLPQRSPSPIQNPTTLSSGPKGPTNTVSLHPFMITRTRFGSLPVYQSTKGGGTKHITTIRKISGDLTELATQVRTALGLEQSFVDFKGRRKENVAINWTTRQVVVRGWRGPEIMKWAELNGF
ncbi:uncharacterized protein Z518_09777 [Rhinocladiella mackenziei CBS 650.93]|uniref:Large ribosomal subunit protein mL49 n=1 Tax=Rhinocladiella mackenziei CBS 650.93 TaxID=1442369 RepID=A0A0D2FFC2_9EURO|nr:uncharacterized protein Z518_09777 [Rhinocladiella mackenziei CBS 650.93]KIX00712.1 hypothetical protein Z518_09777 [Rhinocladiella mackenziei CBS 650.93]